MSFMGSPGRDEFVRALKALSVEDHEKEVGLYSQPEEVYDLMDIDEGVESVISCETRCENNPATFNPMDINKGIEVDTDSEKRGPTNGAAFDPMDSGQETDLYTTIDNDYNGRCSAKGSTRPRVFTNWKV